MATKLWVLIVARGYWASHGDQRLHRPTVLVWAFLVSSLGQKVLRPGGRFIVYQFTTNCLEHIKPNFSKIEQDRVCWNMPPLHLFWAYKE